MANLRRLVRYARKEWQDRHIDELAVQIVDTNGSIMPKHLANLSVRAAWEHIRSTEAEADPNEDNDGREENPEEVQKG